MEEEEDAHPSWGIASVHNVSGMTRLFDSTLEHQHTIRLEVKRATRRRELNRDWIYARESLIEVEMSQVQWASLISTPNTQGVPCTLKWVIGSGRMPDPPPDTQQEDRFKSELKDKAAGITARVARLQERCDQLQTQPAVSKKERAELSTMVRMVKQELVSNLPFLMTSFQEEMEKTVARAKAEFEGYMAQALYSKGLAMAQDELPLLLAEEGGEP